MVPPAARSVVKIFAHACVLKRTLVEQHARDEKSCKGARSLFEIRLGNSDFQYLQITGASKPDVVFVTESVKLRRTWIALAENDWAAR
eukprot:858354-Amphidinium_carterae.1